MRILCLLVIPALMLLGSCSKKTHPNSSSRPKSSEKKNTVPELDIPANIPPTVVPESHTTTANFTQPMIVIDETGKIITSRDNLPPDIAAKVDYKKITRSFTPAQRQNLIYRFKMVPPRILFVPELLASKSAKGYYCVYKKKFWYWKKEDGLFYLDETYYQ